MTIVSFVLKGHLNDEPFVDIIIVHVICGSRDDQVVYFSCALSYIYQNNVTLLYILLCNNVTHVLATCLSSTYCHITPSLSDAHTGTYANSVMFF